MAQKGISLLSKVGATQHWAGSWDSYKSLPATQTQFWLVDRVITVFISSRNSFHTGLVNIDLCWDQVAYLECDVKETDFLSLSQSVRKQRTKRLMPLTVGKIVFLRMQS